MSGEPELTREIAKRLFVRPESEQDEAAPVSGAEDAQGQVADNAQEQAAESVGGDEQDQDWWSEFLVATGDQAKRKRDEEFLRRLHGGDEAA
jgi:hypothetical protein